MSQEDEDQDALAAQWAAELEADGVGDPDATPAGGDDDALANEWAEALAADEEKRGPATFGSPASGAGTNAAGGAYGAQASDAHFQDMTEIAKQP